MQEGLSECHLPDHGGWHVASSHVHGPFPRLWVSPGAGQIVNVRRQRCLPVTLGRVVLRPIGVIRVHRHPTSDQGERAGGADEVVDQSFQIEVDAWRRLVQVAAVGPLDNADHLIGRGRKEISSRLRFNYQRHSPDQRLADTIEKFWTVTWDLTREPDFIAKVLPYPAANMSVTNEQADVTGLVRSRYDRHLTGRGYAVGARFRPGCFRPFLGSSVSKLTDTHRPIAEVFGRDTTRLQRTVAATSDLGERVSALTDFLLVDLPDPDPLAVRIARLVEEVAARAEITRVAQVAEPAGLNVRTLERLFAEYVGAGPKWVIARCRLQHAAARAATSSRPDWAALAAELGFADQAHLTRAFSDTIGTPPGAYAHGVRSHA